MNIEKLLAQMGHTKNEVQVYIATLELGVDSAQNIAKKARVPRTTAYSVLSVLVEKGLVGKTKDHGKTRYVGEPPEKLVLKLEEIQKELITALPELEARYNRNDHKPKIIFFEGSEATKKIYEDTLKEKPSEILEWNTDSYFDKLPDYPYIESRRKFNIHAKRIAGKGSKWETIHKKQDKYELSETIAVPKDIFWPGIEVNIYNNKVAFMNFVENMSVIIESKPIADAMRQAYYLSWLGAKSIEV